MREEVLYDTYMVINAAAKSATITKSEISKKFVNRLLASGYRITVAK